MRSVQAAFRDAHDVLVAAHRSARDSYVAQDERRAQYAEALRLAELRYNAGYTSYIEVLDNQRNLLDAERARLRTARAAVRGRGPVQGAGRRLVAGAVRAALTVAVLSGNQGPAPS